MDRPFIWFGTLNSANFPARDYNLLTAKKYPCLE